MGPIKGCYPLRRLGYSHCLPVYLETIIECGAPGGPQELSAFPRPQSWAQLALLTLHVLPKLLHVSLGNITEAFFHTTAACPFNSPVIISIIPSAQNNLKQNFLLISERKERVIDTSMMTENY